MPIRSLSTAFRHGLDFEKLFNLKEFDVITRSGIDRLVKPILMLTADRGSFKLVFWDGSSEVCDVIYGQPLMHSVMWDMMK